LSNTLNPRNQKVLKNQGLVRRLIAAKYGPRAAHDEDLLQAGLIGLVKAVDAFEAGQIVGRFSSYARTCIISELGKAWSLASVSGRIIPHRQLCERIAIQRHTQELAHQLGREPTTPEIIAAWPRNGARPPRRRAFARALEPDPVVVVTENPEADVEPSTDVLDIEDALDAKRRWERLSTDERERLLREAVQSG
jgi:hypothetical protein